MMINRHYPVVKICILSRSLGQQDTTTATTVTTTTKSGHFQGGCGPAGDVQNGHLETSLRVLVAQGGTALQPNISASSGC